MSDRVFELHFVGVSTAELFQTKFHGWADGTMRNSVRGKTSGAYTNAGSFQLSSAVRALCVLCVRSVVLYKSKSEKQPLLMGEQGSLAASLDYALTKQPMWIQEMFGFDAAGNSLGQRLFSRTNSHRKRPGPVVIKVNEKALPIDNIKAYWNGKRLDDIEELQQLLALLDICEEREVPEAHPQLPHRKLAA